MWLENLINIHKVDIEGIPTMIFRPKNYTEELKVIFVYHGWSCDKTSHNTLCSFLACNGYMAVISDAIHHGERGILEYWDNPVAMNNFWPTVFNSLKEFPVVLNYILSNYNVDKSSIGVTGHSMGGIVTSGILAHNPIVKCAVIMNSSGAWEETSIDFVGDTYKDIKETIDAKLLELKPYSPINNIDNFKNKPVLLLHGLRDALVPIRGENIFYDTLKNSYDDKEKTNFITYERLNHYVTEAMIGEAIDWFNKYM